MYQVIYNSLDDGENGLYFGTQQIASAWLLRKLGHDVCVIVGWSQSSLGKIAKQVELYLNLKSC